MLPIMSDENLVWHYTTVEGLIGMLTRHELWASSVSFMNDPQEDRYAMDVMDKAFELLPRSLGTSARSRHDDLRSRDQWRGYSDRFVACACRNGDLLEMWRSYGPDSVEGTFAVGLEASAPLGLFVPDNKERDGAGVPTASPWTPVVYATREESAADAAEQLRLRFEAIRGDSSDPEDPQVQEWFIADDVLDELAGTRKHIAYRAEQELRVTVTAERAPIRLRSSRFGPVPYLPLTGGVDAWGERVQTPGQLPIRKIVTWPGAPSQARKGVIAALDEGGHFHDESEYGYERSWAACQAFGGSLPSVTVRKSRVPFLC